MNEPRGRPFEPGNKFGKGRPKGSRNKGKAEQQKILEEYAAPLMRKCVVLALKGDRTALRLCIDRVSPVRRDAPVSIRMPRIRSAGDIVAAAQQVTRSMAKGMLSPGEGEKMMNVLESQSRVIDNAVTESRIEKLEQHCTNLDEGSIDPAPKAGEGGRGRRDSDREDRTGS